MINVKKTEKNETIQFTFQRPNIMIAIMGVSTQRHTHCIRNYTQSDTLIITVILTCNS